MWQGKPVWVPSAWTWITIGVNAVQPPGISRGSRLKSVRQFPDKKAGAAIELLVGFKKAIFSTVIRLDDAAAVNDLFKILDSLHGYSLETIGKTPVARLSSQIVAKLQDVIEIA